MRPLGLSLLLASLALLCSCAEQASELPSVTPKLVALSDANPYQNGWRDAGFRLDPADKIAVIGRDGWPGVTSMERIGNDLFFATNPYGDSSLYAGASWYRYVPGTNRYEWLPFPDQGALEGWVLLDSISYL